MIIGMVRYAIPNAFGKKDNSRSVLQLYEEPYFSDRLNIFKNITLESFRQQTCKDFKLLIYQTELIPSDKKEIFDNLEKEYGFIKNVYIPDKNMYVPDELKEDKFLTFRIDNDDGIATDFIENLQKIKTEYDKDLVISTPKYYRIGRYGANVYKLLQRSFVSNSIGIAYLSKSGKTVIDLGNHRFLVENNESKLLKGNRGLQVINGYNVANRFKNDPTVKTLSYKDAKEFLIKKQYGDLDISVLPILN